VDSYIARGFTSGVWGTGRNAEATTTWQGPRSQQLREASGSNISRSVAGPCGSPGGFGKREARMGVRPSSNWRDNGRSSGGRVDWCVHLFLACLRQIIRLGAEEGQREITRWTLNLLTGRTRTNNGGRVQWFGTRIAGSAWWKRCAVCWLGLFVFLCLSTVEHRG
jgi:hypothetical protein